MKFIIVIIVAIMIQIIYFLYSSYSSVNNVCKTFKDYYTNRDSNKNCYYNPDYKLTVPELVRRYGYSLETYNVTTTDGYILTLFRIPQGKLSNQKENPVLLTHGFGGSSASFVGKKNKSLGFLLSNAGYDVWLGNFRGNTYSRNHKYLDTSDSRYWDFSFHENGKYDVPAFIEFIANKTKQKQKIICIAYSIGGASNYVYGTTYPQLAAQRVEIFINLAPAVFLINVGFPMNYFLSFVNFAKELFPFDKIAFSKKISSILCSPYPFQMQICYNMAFFCSGYYYKQIDPEVLPSLINHVFDTMSSKSLIHFSQLLVSGESRQFYYDQNRNMQLYGSEEPPQYNLSKISVPSYTIRVNDDTLVTKEGVEKLYNGLPKHFNTYEIHVINVTHFSHVDLLFGINAEILVSKHVLDFLDSR